MTKQRIARVERVRDLTLVHRTGQPTLVIACDSCGSIGEKPNDTVYLDPATVGYFLARVAVMEVLSVGADIITVVDTLAVEMEPTGKKIIGGILTLLKEVGLSDEYINGSTEDNFSTCQTGIGITVIGETSQLKLRLSKPGDVVAMTGIPVSGSAVAVNDPKMCSIFQLIQLVGHRDVHDIHPVGSKGAIFEANLLGEMNDCKFYLSEDLKRDVYATGGPATSVIFSASPDSIEILKRTVVSDIEVIGFLQE